MAKNMNIGDGLVKSSSPAFTIGENPAVKVAQMVTRDLEDFANFRRQNSA